jgi:hypothetical protein
MRLEAVNYYETLFKIPDQTASDIDGAMIDLL